MDQIKCKNKDQRARVRTLWHTPSQKTCCTLTKEVPHEEKGSSVLILK